jgi:hypothetical protein
MNLLSNFLSDIASEAVVGLIALVLGYLWHRWHSPAEKIGRGSSRVSKNGRTIVTEVDGEILVSDQHGTRNLTRHKALDYNSLLSNNGKYIAFNSERSGGWDVYVVGVMNGKISRLTTGKGNARPLSWNLNGDLLIDMGGSQILVWAHEIEKRLK